MARNIFRTSNPTMREEIFDGQGVPVESADPMTLTGTIGKAGILIALTMVTAVIGWMNPSMPLLIGSAIGGLVICLVTVFKKEWSPVTAPLYALVEGLFVGVVSGVVAAALAKTAYANAVPIAVMATMLTFAVMLGLYATRIIRVTETLRGVIVGATIAVFVTYAFSWIASIFWSQVWNLPIYQSGWAGITFSVVVIAIAAMNLLLDFDLIENGVKHRLPKYMEWYAGFGLLVTLIWLYIEILKLILKLANNR
jgi:uncharacterized YccA/Bax inhibitor family protein